MSAEELTAMEAADLAALIATCDREVRQAENVQQANAIGAGAMTEMRTFEYPTATMNKRVLELRRCAHLLFRTLASARTITGAMEAADHVQHRLHTQENTQ